MTRAKLEELNDMLKKIDNSVAVIDFLEDIKDGDYVSNSKYGTYFSSETVEKLLHTMWEYNHQLNREFEEM